MKKKSIIAIILSIIIFVGIGISTLIFLNLGNQQTINYNYSIEVAFPNLSFTNPVGIYDPDDGTNRLFVIEQTGKVKVFENDYQTGNMTTFLDIGDEIISGGEQGLLGLAFHPNFEINGYFYLYYTEAITGDTIVSRFSVNSSDMNKGNKTSEFEIFTIPQPYPNHNGGQIQFGTDGYLYIGLGDGGGSLDPSGHGQNRQTELGAILRINVDSGSPYSIPVDNPFFGNIYGYAEEIYAFGFRNPWRFNFDPVTNNLWVGDVGQNNWEEIDIVEKGKNYGWKTREGSHDLYPGTNVTNIVNPIYEYNHSFGTAITGGFVYRGSRLTGLIGNYIYADYGSGRIWALELDGGNAKNNTLLIDTILNIPSFGIDSSNNLYICAFNGKIYRLNQVIP